MACEPQVEDPRSSLDRELRYTGLSTTQYIIVPRISRSLTNTAI